ncbi:uncharacterized protein LOC110108489 [Dendrobium catenatum]|uniref:Chromodomain-helicase-DNA-binding protein 4 n=1 Tax=Dendrobium catenatum TaxID=906689 RepID=A0A2I0XGS5_9ASPA|nr:uncharacterized protein LOC110108489 [Dendrobium catenatum]XP_020694819.1 uncharacterized protein LOC110108489 [Dendrobium catenatum]PKU87112.1 chromodomain-helicase-DNA-binding protein 4 [Dendrobium catenatum]
MGKDGDYSEGAKVYESKKEKKRRLAMKNDAESEELVIAPRVEIFQAGNGAASGKRNIVLEKGGARQKSLIGGDVLKRKLGGEGSKGKVLEPRADRKSREIGVAQPDGEDIESEPVDSVGNQADTTVGKSLVSLNDSYEITGSAKEKVFESKFYRKRSMGTGDDEFSRKRAKAENMDSVDNQSEKSGEDNKIMGDSKGDVQVSNLSVPRVKHGDEDSSSERKFQLSPRTSSKSDAVPWLRRSGQREPRKVKDGRSSDVGMKKEVGDGGSSQHSYIRMHGKSGVLRVLKSSKNVAGSENATDQCEEQGNTMRLRSFGTNRLSSSNHQLERQVDKKSISNVKLRKSAGRVSSEDTSRSNVSKVNQENISQMKSSMNTDLLHGKKSGLAAKKTKNTDESNGSRSAVKNKLREQIKGILFDAGWTIELRPRRGRNYEDSVYVSPKGSGYWSITKAYAVYLSEFKSACDDKESSEKEPKASSLRDGECKEANSTFAVIPPEVLHVLKRNVVNKRRRKNEMEDAKQKIGGGKRKKKAKVITKAKYSKDKGTWNDVGRTRVIKRKVIVRNSKRRGCALLVRGFNQDEGSENGDYAPYVWKRTILSWMIDLGVVPAFGKVRYMNKRMSKALLDGRITRDGIQCNCCSKVLTVSKFEIHAGSRLQRPYENVCLEGSGISLLQCQINAWEKQEESTRRIFYDVDTDGDDPNDDTCGICGDGGDLICCDSCPSTFHLACLGIEMLPTGDWHCTNCSCKFCGAAHDSVALDGNVSNTLFTCSQCARKFHKDCVPEDDVVSTVPNSSCNVFCGRSCRKVFRKLQKLTGVRNELEPGFYWSIVRRFEDHSKSLSRMAQTVENNSKIAVAYAVMDECFVPITDQRSGINLIHNVVYNCGSNFNRLNFSGFYTFILERGDEIVAAASVRIHDTRLAEMPFIGTRCMYRRQGMCRRLLEGIEYALRSLSIRKLIIPAISELTETWTAVFGFKPLDISQNQELKSVNMLVFPGTGLLQKSLLNDSTEKLTNPELENKSETQILVEAGKNNLPDEAMDSKESNCDAEAIKPDIPVLENPTSNLPPEESGCHGQFCRSTDSVADAESNDLKSVVSCDNHVENDVSLRNCSNEVVPCNDELKKEPEDVMPPAQPSFPHAASEFLDGNFGSEASDLKPPQNHSYSELLVTDVVENCNSEEDEPKLEDRPPCNGIAHDSNAKQGEFIEADVDRSHEINQVNLTCDANGGLNSNVNQDSIEVSIDGVKHLNISSGNGSYPSSGVCENGSVPNTEPYCLASNESTSQEKSDLLDQLTVNDSTKSPVRTNSTADDLPSKLKESTPEINQQFSAADEVSDDCHVSIVENDADIDESTINQSSKMVK